METGLQNDGDHDTHLVPSKSENKRKRPSSSDGDLEQPTNRPGLFRSPAQAFPQLKWQRLQREYKDQYLNLFKECIDSVPDDNTKSAFSTSQIGASIWQAAEKARFFNALARRGRHDLPGIAKAIGTKSQLEVKVYLDLLQKAELERQLFEQQTKNISQAEYPAAVEIGSEIEQSLDVAADALAAFQEQYDFALAQQEQEGAFLVDRAVAAHHDEQAEQLEESAVHEDDAVDVAMETRSPMYLFRLENFLQLTEHLFMNGSEQDPTNHWKYIAEDDEMPAVSQSAFLEFADIVTNLLRRVTQTALFLAQSRIRARNIGRRSALEVVRVGDIHAALDVLGMPHDSWKYWRSFPRRHNARVVSGSHERGESKKKSISYEEAEEFLSIRHSRGRKRSRSVSSAVSDDVKGTSDSHVSSPSEAEESMDNETEMAEEVEEDDEQSRELSESSEVEHRTSEDDLKRPLTSTTRRLLLDREMDVYLEKLDQQARQQEESRLSQLLGLDEQQQVDLDRIEIGRRPKVHRKEDVRIWTALYEAQWEEQPNGSY